MAWIDRFPWKLLYGHDHAEKEALKSVIGESQSNEKLKVKDQSISQISQRTV